MFKNNTRTLEATMKNLIRKNPENEEYKTILHYLEFPLQLFAMQEAAYQLGCISPKPVSDEHICALAEKIYEESDICNNGEETAEMAQEYYDAIVQDKQVAKNTKIDFLYRDASNYKMYNSCVVAGKMSKDDISCILSCLEDGEYFIPEQVGLEAIRFEEATEDDHPYCELTECDFSFTAESPTADITARELVEAFRKAKDNWDSAKYTPTTEY